MDLALKTKIRAAALNQTTDDLIHIEVETHTTYTQQSSRR